MLYIYNVLCALGHEKKTGRICFKELIIHWWEKMEGSLLVNQIH